MKAAAVRLRRAFESDLGYSFRRSPGAIIAAIVLAMLLGSALFAPWIVPGDPFDSANLNLMNCNTPPLNPNPFTGETFLLGTDNQGRDILAAILYGSRVSLCVGFAAVAFSLVLGTALGLLAGYRGGRLDAFIMRIADVQLSFPVILIALLVFGVARGFIPPQQRDSLAIYVLILSIGLSDWVQYARTVRGATLVHKHRDYIQAAVLIGRSPWAIMLRHILPNVMEPILVLATISLALAIISESTLSFLGVGVPPTQPSLGTLIRVGQGFLFSGEWWILLFPSLALLALALSINILGDWLREALNPRLAK